MTINIDIFVKMLNMKRLIAILFLFLPAIISYAQNRYGVVDFSANFMREEPSYTSGLSNQNLMGTVVEILDSNSYWLKIKSPEPYIGWVNEMGIAKMSREELSDYMAEPKYICTASYSMIYSGPSANSEIISDLVMGDILRIWRKNPGFESKPLKRNGFLGVITPSGRKGYVNKKDLLPMERWAEDADAGAENIIRIAKKFIGVPYLWGGTSMKGVDCSGLTRLVWLMNGVLIPRDAGPQAEAGTGVEIYDKDGNMDISALHPGDLLFFGKPSEGDAPARISHVGIYICDGRFIHSSQVVRISSLRKGDEDYYYRAPVLARRYIGNEGNGSLVRIKYSPFYFQNKKW